MGVGPPIPQSASRSESPRPISIQRKYSHERCVGGLDELVIVDRGSVIEPICQNSVIEPVRSRGIRHSGKLVGSRVENEGVGLRLKAKIQDFVIQGQSTC